VATTALFGAKLQAWLDLHAATENLGEVRVADYLFLGKIYLTTSTAFTVIIGILIGVFVLILVIFIVNLVLLSMIQRRREIGTGIAMGLTNGQTIAVMTGEVAVIVTVSWIAGAVIAVAAIAAAATWGVPGMIFFPGGHLFMTQQLLPHVTTYAILLPASLLAAIIPLSGLRRLEPVDFFREAR
jgi:putative ABC transport system permease protein